VYIETYAGVLGSVGGSEMERRRMMGSDSGFGHHGDQRQSLRPQLRPQRSIDNRQSGLSGLLSQPAGEMTPAQKQQLLDQQQSAARFGHDTNVSKNTQSQMMNPLGGGVDNQGMMIGPQPLGGVSTPGLQNTAQPSAFLQQTQPTTSLISTSNQQLQDFQGQKQQSQVQ